MTVTLQHNNFSIELFDDPAFTQSPDNPTVYDHIYQPDKDHEYKPVSQHAIVVYKDNEKIASAILLAVAGYTAVSEDSVIIRDDNLITRCCNVVVSLSLPHLQLNWMTEADWATCFSIHPYQNDFITYGETSVTRINSQGDILWEYSGADIFVSADGASPFTMYNDHIALRDFNGSTYKIGYDGKTIGHFPSAYQQQKPVTVFLKRKKPWWKFW